MLVPLAALRNENEADRLASQCFVRSILPPLVITAAQTASSEHAILKTVHLSARIFVRTIKNDLLLTEWKDST
jgi:hypothetical protein